MMNLSHDNILEDYSSCYYGECSYVDNTSCIQSDKPDNISGGDLIVDEEGCFSTNQLRTTQQYQKYKTVIIGREHLFHNSRQYIFKLADANNEYDLSPPPTRPSPPSSSMISSAIVFTCTPFIFNTIGSLYHVSFPIICYMSALSCTFSIFLSLPRLSHSNLLISCLSSFCQFSLYTHYSLWN